MIVFTVGDSLPKHFNIFLSLPLGPWPIFSVFDLLMAVFLIPLISSQQTAEEFKLYDKGVQSEKLQH